MRGPVLYGPNQKHHFFFDTPLTETRHRFEGLLRNATDFCAKPSTLNAIRKASSGDHCWTASLELNETKDVHPTRALSALASEEVLATSPRRISRKLNALRGQLASAPASLQGHLHSACYEALLKSGDLTTSRFQGKLNARGPEPTRALSMRSGTFPNPSISALRMMIQPSVSNTGHNIPVYSQSKLAQNSGRPPPGSTRKTRPSTAALAGAAAAQAAEAREKLRSAPATLYSDYDLHEFQTTTSGCRHSAPTRKIHHGSALKQHYESAMKMPLTLEEEQRRARRPIKSVTFNYKQTSSPYNCKMSNQAAKQNKSFRELNYTGITGRSGVPLDVQFMEVKAKNSIKKGGKFQPPVKKRSSSDLQDALNMASTLDLLGEEVGAQQAWCARLTRSLEQQKEMLRLIKRTKGRRAFTCDNIIREISQFETLRNDREQKRPSWSTFLLNSLPEF